MGVLGRPRNNGPFEFVDQIGSERNYVNIFRLLRPEDLRDRRPKD